MMFNDALRTTTRRINRKIIKQQFNTICSITFNNDVSSRCNFTENKPERCPKSRKSVRGTSKNESWIHGTNPKRVLVIPGHCGGSQSKQKILPPQHKFNTGPVHFTCRFMILEQWYARGQWRSTRHLTTLNVNVQSQAEAMVSTEDSRQFTEIFSDIVKDLTETSRKTNVTDITGYYKRMLDSNIPHWKPSIGHQTIASYKMVESPENLTPHNIRLANVLGWCAELLASSFSVNDDVMEASDTPPRWYKKEGVGMRAINDAVILENGLYSLLKKYCSELRCYTSIVELFHEVSNNTAMGQSLDAMTMKDGKPVLETFTMSRYNAITKYRSSYLKFKLPMSAAMYLANMDDAEVHSQASSVLLKIGQLCQIHSDVMDCFGTSATVNFNSNIRNGKCTWLIVEALHRASPDQRELLEQHYGRSDSECEKIVKTLFKELDLLSSYSISNKLTLDVIRQDIERMKNKPLQTLFFKLANQYECRNKDSIIM